MKTLEELKKEANILIETATKEMDLLKNNIEKQNIILKEAEIKKEKALKEGKKEVYCTETEKINRALSELDFNKTKLEQLKTKPIITKQEYDHFIKETFEAFENEREVIINKVMAKAEELTVLSDELLYLINEANNILEMFQTDICKDLDRKRYKNAYGESISKQDKKQLPAYNSAIVQWINTLKSTYIYELLKQNNFEALIHVRL